MTTKEQDLYFDYVDSAARYMASLPSTNDLEQCTEEEGLAWNAAADALIAVGLMLFDTDFNGIARDLQRKYDQKIPR